MPITTRAEKPQWFQDAIEEAVEAATRVISSRSEGNFKIAVYLAIEVTRRFMEQVKPFLCFKGRNGFEVLMNTKEKDGELSETWTDP